MAKDLDVKYGSVFEIISGVLMYEAVLIRSMGMLHLEGNDGTINGPALGYIYGIADAAMQTAKIEIDNENGVLLLQNIYALYADGRGEAYSEHVIRNSNQRKILDAMNDGGQTYINWAKSEGKIMPMGLGKYLGLRSSGA